MSFTSTNLKQVFHEIVASHSRKASPLLSSFIMVSNLCQISFAIKLLQHCKADYWKFAGLKDYQTRRTNYRCYVVVATQVNVSSGNLNSKKHALNVDECFFSQV